MTVTKDQAQMLATLACDPTTCICCVCVLRRSAEFGAAFTKDDECCDGCHDEMSSPEWPGYRCGDNYDFGWLT
jgi:hypothetical protein